jgi:hypothetical protein
VGRDGPPTAALAELRTALLEFSEARARPLLGRRRGRMARRLQRRGLRWLNVLLLLPWLLVGLVGMVVTRRASDLVGRQQRVVSLYRRCSGKDPRVAAAEVHRITDQLLAIDARVKPYGARVATAGATADRAELDAAAEVLLAYHLGGRQTEDALLAEIQAAWVAYEAIGAERKDQALGPAGGRRRSRGELDRLQRAAMDRYLAGWRGWLDRRAGEDAWPGRDG